MLRETATLRSPKISREFATRLERCKPQQKVRTIVLIDVKREEVAAEKPRSRLNRQADIATLRLSAAQALGAIDGILQRFDGKRLAEVNALGSIPVEVTAEGIFALAESQHVKAVLEDQPISLLAQVER